MVLKSKTVYPDLIISIRPMTSTNLSDVRKIQQSCYHSSYWEKSAIFSEKIELFPSGCFVAFVGNLCAGYIFSHPWIKDRTVPLNSPIRSLPNDNSSYYLHDCSVAPQSRSNGIGNKLIEKVIETARCIGARNIQLVSVQQSKSYWGRFGFAILESTYRKSNNQLVSYGTDAVMMSLALQ